MNESVQQSARPWNCRRPAGRFNHGKNRYYLRRMDPEACDVGVVGGILLLPLVVVRVLVVLVLVVVVVGVVAKKGGRGGRLRNELTERLLFQGPCVCGGEMSQCVLWNERERRTGNKA